MIARLLVIILALTAGIGANTGQQKTLRVAVQGDLNSLDPYTLNESHSLSTLANVYEGLVKRDAKLEIVPGLAERWEVLAPRRWRFHLRKGVTFHDGTPFDADDVVFSADRVRADGSQLKSRLPARRWSEANGALKVQPARAQSLGSFALKANGTGPFVLVSHVPGVKTVLRRNPAWWGKAEHNLDEIVLQTVASDATRVAALLAGDVDLIDPVPLQDIDHVKSSRHASVLSAPEVRTIYLNLDSFRDELLYATVKGKNPFKDARVRKAVYQAIDIEAIRAKVMRGMSVPSALLLSPDMFARAGEFSRWPYDPVAARRLMQEAGYAEGFGLTLDCPNDRYINDEEICQAVAIMLARIGIVVKVNALPKAPFFEKAGPTRKYDSSFNLVGWNAFDSWAPLTNVVRCRDADGKGGTFNFGGYCNPKIDKLTDAILVEPDTNRRNDMIAQAFRMLHEDAGIIPLHQQALAWGVAGGVTVVPRGDGHMRFHWVTKQ
jgi:peptide/nickel transport system substrate-binding protein